MTLYEIEQSILECVDTETGEVVDFNRMNQLTLDRNTMIDNLACWYKQLNAESVAIDVEISALESRKKAKKNKAENLKHYLSDILSGARFESPRNQISWRASDEVCIWDSAKIPSEYKSEKIEVTISKCDIKKAIKAGGVVDGADLLHKNNIQIK